MDREAYLPVGSDNGLGDIGGYRKGYNPDGTTNASGSLNFLSSQTSSSVNTPLYPSASNRGQRSSEALLNAAAECYIEGVSTRDRGKILEQFGIESMSSTQLSNTNEKLYEGFDPWRNRGGGLEEFPYLILNAGYEKLRLTGIVRDVTVLTAVGIDKQGNRRILGVSKSSLTINSGNSSELESEKDVNHSRCLGLGRET